MAKKLIYVISLLSITAVLLAACGTPAASTGGSGASVESTSGPSSVATPADAGLSQRVEDTFPEDLPLPDGAYKVDVSAGGTQVSYQHDGTIEQMVTFLQEELPAFGWDIQGSPDSAVGAIATMLRKNEAGDTLSVNMQYNANGDFVTLTMAILRAK